MVMSDQHLLDLHRHMLSARILDEIEAEYCRTGEASFHVSGAGHESTAVLAFHLRPEDWLHCHYRDKALMLARGVSPDSFFQSLFCRATSHSSGRQMNAHMSCPERNVLSIVGPVGNNALQAVGVASVIRDRPGDPIVYCAIGDGSTQQGEVLEAFGQAAREQVPVLFVIQHNGYAISTRTDGKTLYNMGGAVIQAFSMGCQLPSATAPMPSRPTRYSSRSCTRCGATESRTRWSCVWSAWPVIRTPTIRKCIAAGRNCGRRASGTRSRAGTSSDGPRRSARSVAGACKRTAHPSESGGRGGEDRACAGTLPGREVPLPEELRAAQAGPCHEASGAGLTMLQAIHDVLRFQLAKDPRVSLFGEDLEDPKGDVFGVTRGLSTEFPGRVTQFTAQRVDDRGPSHRPGAGGREACGLPAIRGFRQSGVQSGRQRNGFHALALQRGVGCAGDRDGPVRRLPPGTGTLPSQTHDATLTHIPGIDVFMPSNAVDAAGLLNAAFRSGRPTVFLYPKNLLNDRGITLDAPASRPSRRSAGGGSVKAVM